MGVGRREGYQTSELSECTQEVDAPQPSENADCYNTMDKVCFHLLAFSFFLFWFSLCICEISLKNIKALTR